MLVLTAVYTRLRKIAVVIISLLVVLYLGLVIVALLPQETIPISTLSGPQDKFIMVNGQTIHYLKQGNGKPLIFGPRFCRFDLHLAQADASSC